MIYVTIPLAAGYKGSKAVTQEELQRNIDALSNAAQGKAPTVVEQQLMMDTRSILEAIKSKLPSAHRNSARPEIAITHKLRDLHRQATEERSHFYVANVVEEAIAEIRRLQEFEWMYKDLQR